MSDEIIAKDPVVLMKLANKGDSKAFGILYEMYFTPVFRYIYFRIRSREDAEDLAQSVFLKVYASVQDYNDFGRSPIAYFFTAARNITIDYFRKKKTVYLEDYKKNIENLEDNRDNPQKMAEMKESVEKIERLIKNLNKDQQEIIILKLINDLPYSEIAKILNKTEAAVRQAQCRALKEIRKQFKKF